jgi:hypothetical protein
LLAVRDSEIKGNGIRTDVLERMKWNLSSTETLNRGARMTEQETYHQRHNQSGFHAAEYASGDDCIGGGFQPRPTTEKVSIKIATTYGGLERRDEIEVLAKGSAGANISTYFLYTRI